MSTLRPLADLIWNVVCFPVRQWRRRLGVQLLSDHLLAGVLGIIAIFAIIIGILYGYITPHFIVGDSWDIDSTMGDKARAASYRVDPNLVAAAAGGDTSATQQLNATLRDMVPEDTAAGGGPGVQPISPDVQAVDQSESRTYNTLPGVDHALIVNTDGTVVASTDSNWASPGQSVDAMAFEPLRSATNDVLAANGGAVTSSAGENYTPDAYSLEYDDHITVSAFPIINDDGQVVGAVVLQGIPFDLRDYVSIRDLVREVFTSEWRTLLFIVLAGFTASVPIASWRARMVSRRVKRLTLAADAWAAGDLNRRVAIRGEDEIGRLGQHFNGMSERLAATDQARRAFVANVSHDLRTPVAIMRGHLERLLDGTEGRRVGGSEGNGSSHVGEAARNRELVFVDSATPRVGTFSPTLRPSDPPTLVDPATLELLHRETVTLSRLIDDLFTLARVEETHLPLELGPLDLATVAEESVEGLKELAWTQSKVTVQSLIRPELPAVMADPTRIRQILNNLIFNALRHTPAGGLVLVDAKELGTPSRPGQIEVSVMDTGVGIPPEKLPSIFERFFQGNEGARSTGEGSGLGLHIVKQLVEAQGGTISVESSLGQGTVFRFRLPRAVAKTKG